MDAKQQAELDEIKRKILIMNNEELREAYLRYFEACVKEILQGEINVCVNRE